MSLKIFILIFIPIVVGCSVGAQKVTFEYEFQSKDKEIIEQVFTILNDDVSLPVSVLMIKVGTFFKETPYVAATLETNPEKEKLVINLREMDCTTFAENCLAISRTIKNGNPTFEKFAKELQTIRYRNGKIEDYSSRLHYFSDWIFDNNLMKITKSISKELAETRYPKTINFMSTHPESYRQLKGNPEMVRKITKQETEISARETYFIPKEIIGEIESRLMDGDIVGITSKVEGLDISHVGILIRKEGRIYLLHASTVAKKVIISVETLEDYLLGSKSVTGIMVARPL